MELPKKCPECGSNKIVVLHYRSGKKFRRAALHCSSCHHLFTVKEEVQPMESTK